MLKRVIVQSGNNATIALTEGIAGSEEIFVNYMNEAAKELGLDNSYFMNSTRWPDLVHKISAIDLTKLAAALIRDFSEYYHYFKEQSFTFNKNKSEQ